MASTVPKKLKIPNAIIDILRETLRSGSTSALIKQGYTYLQISTSLSSAIASGLIVEKDGNLDLTQKGRTLFLDSRKKCSFIWLKPLNELRVEKIKKDDLYIPERRSLKKVQKLHSRTSN
jgi:hypothetical protein